MHIVKHQSLLSAVCEPLSYEYHTTRYIANQSQRNIFHESIFLKREFWSKIVIQILVNEVLDYLWLQKNASC